ncbi:MAG: M81 family metallopeptidase [Planctomycetaceae bacterium]|nr:M81 family metallopeptidase [Planctomycetaceae bacterium]
MKVGVITLLQETNTFIAEATTLRHFEENLLLTGEPVRAAFADASHEVGGMFAGLDQAGIEAVPIFATRALPFGTVTDETYATLKSRLMDALASAGPLDGLLLAPHGATVSASVRDVDGDWMSAVRAHVGPELPIIASADPHANLTPTMVAAVNGLTAYRTNPHIDQKARGLEAASLMARTLRGEIRPVVAAAFPPTVMNIDRQCTDEEPCQSLCRRFEELRQRPGILSASLFLGFPYADVPEMGSAVLVVADGDRQLAERSALELGTLLWDRRADFVANLISPADGIEQARTLPGPVCLLDMGDNVGGGSAADGTTLIHELHRRRLGPAFACLSDPEAVRRADAAGAGAKLSLRVGGKTDDLHGPPLEARFTVLQLNDGRFEEPEARHGGIRHYDQGRTAVVRTDDGLTLMLTTRRMVPFSLHQLTDFGIDPKSFQYIIAKGVNAPLAAYKPVCPSILRVNTPGSTTADIESLTYHERRRPLYPFEHDTQWTPCVGRL